jgi:hypothetical protein
MRDLTLFRAMLGLPSSVNVLKHLEGPAADSESCFFIETGHLMEFMKVNYKKVICLFWGPGEFVIRCHPDSDLECLDPGNVSHFQHEDVIKFLRKYPECRVAYHGIRKGYYEKVAERLRVRDMPVEKRFEHLQKNQPWVFDFAERKDIACYLGISLSILAKLTK